MIWVLTVGQALCFFGLTGQLAHYLRTTPRVDTPEQLARYEHIVRGQMLGALATMVTIPAIAIVIAVGQEPNWIAISPSLAAMLGLSWAGRLNKAARTQPVAAELLERHRLIGEIWEAKALPRFPSATTLASSPRTSLTTSCPVHGPEVAARTCPTCQTVICVDCGAGDAGGIARCPGCAVDAEAVREQHWRSEVIVRSTGGVLAALGSADLVVAFTPVGELVPGGQAVMLALGVLGVVAIAVSTGVSGLAPWARNLGLITAAPHVLIFPTGTLMAAILIVALGTGRGAELFSEKYRSIVARTRNRGLLHHLIGLVVGVALLLVHLVVMAVIVAFVLEAPPGR